MTEGLPLSFNSSARCLAVSDIVRPRRERSSPASSARPARRFILALRMRIVLVNWAMVWDGAVKGGGVNGYCQSLALELVARGHDVVYLCGGVTYVPLRVPAGSTADSRFDAGRCEIRRHPDWLGVRVFEVMNSPVVAPSIHQFADPAGEIDQPELEEKVGAFFRLIEPDVVHFHNLEGFSAGCVRAARVGRSTGGTSKVFYSLHNYHTVCPQVYLMKGHRFPCHDFQGGRACETCIPTEAPELEVQRRMRDVVRTLAIPALPVPPPPPGPRSPLLHQLRAEVTNLLRQPSAPESPPPPAPPPDLIPPLPGAEIASSQFAASPLPVDGIDQRGQTAHILSDQKTHAKLGPGDPEWQPLPNVARPDPSGIDPSAPYGRRRQTMIDMLNACDGVLAVSEFVRAKFQALGVRGDVIRTHHIGTRLNRVARVHNDVLFDPPPFDRANPRPVRLAFIGFNSYFKGLPMFADTLELLEADVLRRLHLYIYGIGVGADEWRFRRMEPRLGGLTMNPSYAYYDVPWILGGKDIGIVPSIWWDNAPQTVFECFACGVPVLGANAGGIPDFVTDGVNGLLFAANDRYDLARRLREIVEAPWKLFELRANVRPPKDIGDHAAELERLYASGLGAIDALAGRKAAGPDGLPAVRAH